MDRFFFSAHRQISLIGLQQSTSGKRGLRESSHTTGCRLSGVMNYLDDFNPVAVGVVRMKRLEVRTLSANALQKQTLVEIRCRISPEMDAHHVSRLTNKYRILCEEASLMHSHESRVFTHD